MTQQLIVDCSTGQTALVAMTPQEQATLDAQQQQAQQQAQQRAAALAFTQQQSAALAAVSAALHDAWASADAAALAGLVHKLVADPVQPLSAPEQATLARFMLRCLLVLT